MQDTTIGLLANIIDASAMRQDAIEGGAGRKTDSDYATMQRALSHWSDQHDAVQIAMLHEQALTVTDALSLAIVAYERLGAFFPVSADGIDDANTAVAQISGGLESVIDVLATTARSTTSREKGTVGLCRRLVVERDPFAHRFEDKLVEADSTAWAVALDDYRAKRGTFDALPDGDPNEDAVVNGYHDAMDHLIVYVPAPDLEAASMKADLAASRCDSMGYVASLWDAVRADLARLAGGEDR